MWCTNLDLMQDLTASKWGVEGILESEESLRRSRRVSDPLQALGHQNGVQKRGFSVSRGANGVECYLENYGFREMVSGFLVLQFNRTGAWGICPQRSG